MYSETAGSRKTIGDVDVLFHDGIYHLFHLVLPNHDFVAHAVSNDCMTWRRVENALFLGEPGSWDDSMLWTVHVSADPSRPGSWRMFYTGLSRRDHGQKQRIGLAKSDDLYVWQKSAVDWTDRRSELPYALPGRPAQPPFPYDSDSCFPIDADGTYYESEVDEARNWVSWRDPFYYREGDRGWLLAAGRVNHGPVVRRGCVALMEETLPDHFESSPPLHHPGLYDDVEVPNLLKLGDQYYLIGSMREDAKIRYWHADALDQPWKSYADNVLLAAGNYAGRISHDEQGILLWSFFTPHGVDRTCGNLMPPPKRLVQSESGQLNVESFEGFDSRVDQLAEIGNVECLRTTCTSDVHRIDAETMELDGHCSFQIFALEGDFDCFRLKASLRMLNEGKCGIVFRLNRETHDGYYLSLDLFKGLAQVRAWGSGPDGSGEEMMQFRSLQAAYWEQQLRGEADVCLLVYGSYIELSVGGRVMLSLADQTFANRTLGFYVESGKLRVDRLSVERFVPPVQSDEHLANG